MTRRLFPLLLTTFLLLVSSVSPSFADDEQNQSQLTSQIATMQQQIKELQKEVKQLKQSSSVQTSQGGQLSDSRVSKLEARLDALSATCCGY